MSAMPATNPLLDAALGYAAQGLEVFPCKPNKAPYTEHGMKDATTDPGTITAWWRQWPNALVAARIPEDRVVIDIDPRHGGIETWHALQDSYGDITSARSHLSGRDDGGQHHWFKRPEGKLTAKKLHEFARKNGTGHPAGKRGWTSGLDLLHHTHRYSILPPSPHPDTGKPYRWMARKQPQPMPAFLADLVVADPPPATPPKLRQVRDTDSVADWFSSHHTWNEILQPAGWVLVSGDGNSDGSKWRHPQASAESSASVRHDCLFVYSENTDFDVTEDGDPHGYTRFRAWSILEHDEDMSAAAREALDMRDGPNTTPTIDTFDPGEPPTEWPDPEPLTGTTDPVPFPVHIFPEWIQRQVDLAAKEMQCPPDLPAMLAITGLSIATAGRVKVHISSSWYETTNTYLVTGLRPGENKSPNVKLMLGPLDQFERDLQVAADADRGRIETERKILTKRHTKAIESGVLSEALVIQDELDALPDTTSPRIIADDSTPEKMVDLLGQHGGRMAIVSTEGGVFQLMTGRYSEKSNLDVYLMAWSGDTIRVDRIGREGSVVREPALTVGLTVQPSVIAQLSETPELRGRGLTARFMYSVPQSLVGHRDMRRVTAVDQAVIADYSRQMMNLARHHYHLESHKILPFSAEAFDLFVEWRQDLENRRKAGGDLVTMTEWTIKLESTVARLAGLLHLADGADGEISGDVMRRAIIVGRYWEVHARIAHELWMPDPVTQCATKILRWAIEQQKTEFSIRDAYSVDRRAMPRAEDAIDPLQTLVEKGWLRLAPGERLEVGRRGKPSPMVAVHPDAATVGGQVARMRAMRVKANSELSSSSSGEGDTEGSPRAHGAHARMTPEDVIADDERAHGAHDIGPSPVDNSDLDPIVDPFN